jgi:hypothetical protein
VLGEEAAGSERPGGARAVAGREVDGERGEVEGERGDREPGGPACRPAEGERRPRRTAAQAVTRTTIARKSRTE